MALDLAGRYRDDGYVIARGLFGDAEVDGMRTLGWFPDPERFVPGRFSPGWESRIERHAYVPFGAGTRTCIGRGLAEASARAVVSVVIEPFRFELVPGRDERPQPLAPLRPRNGLRFLVRRTR